MLFVTARAVGCVALVHGSPVALAPAQLLLLPEADVYVSWGEWDLALRLRALQTGRLLSEMEQLQDELLCAHTPPGGRVVALGGSDRAVQLWKKTVDTTAHLSLRATLYGHDGSVTCVHVCEQYSVAVSGSADCTCIVWDLNRLRYIRSIVLPLPVEAVAVSPESGDIFVATRGHVYLFSINGESLGSAPCAETLTCALFAAAVGGDCARIMAGAKSGALVVFDAGDLTRSWFRPGATTAALLCLALDDSCTSVVSGSADGCVQRWANTDGFNESLGI